MSLWTLFNHPRPVGSLLETPSASEREGAFVTPQSLASFAGASTFITIAWKASGQLVEGWDHSRQVAAVIAGVVGLVLYLISETDPARGPVTFRDRAIAFVFAAFNTIVLFSAAIGAGEMVSSGG
jgi:hypothetical protein